MTSQNSLIFHTQRIPWIGAAVLCAAFLLSLPFLLMLSSPASFFVPLEKKGEGLSPGFSFSLNLNEKIPFLQLPELENEILFSFDPPRPGGTEGAASGQQVLIHLNKSCESMRAALPCRIDLRYIEDKLCFSPSESSFWIELALSPGKKIEGKIFASDPSETILAGSFIASAQESPVRSAQEFPEGSPFRALAEARWWGHDLFREFYEGKTSSERLECGSSSWLELKEGDWIVCEEGLWRPMSTDEKLEQDQIKNQPIARIQSNLGKTLSIEGWDLDGHVRLSLPPAANPAMKTRGEDLFSSIRIRSEKQISCMLEKQCLILKAGDWVLKSENRWKVLRKKGERESFLNGKSAGELFVFEQILQKQGQKVMQGRLFNLGRSQAVSIEMTAQSMRKSLDSKDPAAAGRKRDAKR